MRITRKNLIVILSISAAIGVLAFVGLTTLVLYVFRGEFREVTDDPSAIRCTLEWGRLAPLPGSASEFTMMTGGSMFTREFRASFAAPAGDIERWLEESPGTRAARDTTPSAGVRHFEIAPGGGAQHAEVNVDDLRHRVSIYVYWS
jgi:hypothetical protein